MHRETASFTVRIELEASFDESYEGDEDGGEWLGRWMAGTRPEVVAAVVRALAADRRFTVTPRSRGRSPEDEIEVLVALKTR